MKRFLFLLAVASPFAMASAQTPAVSPAPSLAGPPVQKRAPDFACWSTVTSRSSEKLTSVKPADEPSPSPQKEKHAPSKNKPAASPSPNAAAENFPGSGPISVITKTSRIIHVERTDEQKQTWNIWITGGHEISLAPGSDTVAEVAPPSNPDMDNPLYTDFTKTDFPGFEWLSPKNFAGVEEFDGRACLIFREHEQRAESAEHTASAQASVERFAAVDYYSRLPAALAVGGVMQEYVFKFPPQTMLILPEKSRSHFKPKRPAKRPRTGHPPSRIEVAVPWIMKTFSLLIVVTVFCSGGLPAQSPTPAAAPTPPPGPLIQKKAPDFARWVITARTTIAKAPDNAPTVASSNPAASAAETTVTVTKTGPVVHVERTDEQHRTWQTWCRGAVQVAVAPDGKGVNFVAPPPNRDVVNPLYFDFSKSDFEGFEWISANNFTGIKPVMGKSCLVFKDERNVSGILAPASKESATSNTATPAPVRNAVVACVDADTRLPVALMNDNGVFAYQFEKSPETMQDFPPNVQALLDKQKLDIQAVKRKPSSPY